MSTFQKATKRAVRARIALDGPSGSGKTWTGLTWATVLGKKIAVVDTERGSASLYADHFDFDVVEFSPPFHPDRLVDAIRAAEKAGYEVLVVDSLSHFWEGEGGTLDVVDAAAARQGGNSWAGWKSGTPVLRHLVDAVLASDLHVIATMRSKTEWVLEEKINRNGQKVTDPKRVGMAPVFRAGMEYEFTLVGDLDLEHRLTITKSRCDALADKVIQPGRAAEAAETFVAWTNSGEEIASRSEIDALKARINQIEPRDARVAAKQGFAEQFGNPDFLVASKLAEAAAYIGQWEAPADNPDRPFDDEPPAAPPEPAAAAPAPAADTPAAAPKRGQRTLAQQLHIDAYNILAGTGHNPEETLDMLILSRTGGRTSSANDLTDKELNELHFDLCDVRDGKIEMDHLRQVTGHPAGAER